MSGKLIALLAVAGLVLYLVFKSKGTTFGTAAQPFHQTAMPLSGGSATGGIANLENSLARTLGNLFNLAPATPASIGTTAGLAQAEIYGATDTGIPTSTPFLNQGPIAPYTPSPPPLLDQLSPDSGVVGADTLAGLGTSFDTTTLAPPVFTEALSYNAIEGT
jgi:hypothetical protein